MNEETMQSEKTDGASEKIVIPLFDIVVYPESRTKFQVDRATGELLLEAMKDEKNAHAVGLTVKSGTRPQELTGESLYRTGNLFHIAFVQPADDGYVICAEIMQRVKVISFREKDGRFYATCEPVPDVQDLEDELKARILTDIKLTIHEMSSRFTGSERFTEPIDHMDTADQIMGFVMPFLPVHLAEKQALLEIVSVRERYITFLELLMKTKENISIRIEMAKKVTDRVSRSNREAMLREQMRVIQEELGETDGTAGEGGYRERIGNSKMPDDVRKKALVEARKLETGGSQNHESSVIRNYLDLLLDLPWITEERKSIDIAEARRVLESHHNGLEKVKERIIQHLAVMKLKQEKQGSILLFAGPPGTGKTSLGKSIAEALGRKYVRISLGGVRDEAEIRGHRRT
jgi:ATP-dependent Lon protease